MSHFSARPRTVEHSRQSEDQHVCVFTNEDRKTEDPRAHACTHVNARTCTCMPSELWTEKQRTLVHTLQYEDLHVCVFTNEDRKTEDVCALQVSTKNHMKTST